MIGFIERLFCKHDWELIQKIGVRDMWHEEKVIIGYVHVYRCKKCCKFRKVKS